MARAQSLIISLAAIAGAAVLAACGSSGGTGSPSAPQSGAAATSSAPGTTSAALQTASVGSLGTIVVNGQGMTVYRFDADSNNPPTSNCSSSCTTYWPPVTAGSGTPQVQGISASLLGTITRSDGTKQLTLAGWPLYTFTGDHAAGDAKGQGLNASGAKWWAVTPTGAKAGSSSGGSPSSTYTSGSGY
jgi:predicted lipoprotein with Yx(FWY)xxD motif